MRTPEEERLWNDLKRQAVLASNAGGVLDKALGEIERLKRLRPTGHVRWSTLQRLGPEDLNHLRSAWLIVDEDGKPLAELWPLPVRP